MRRFLRENGLSITLLGLFFVIQVGFSLVGQRQYNQEQADHGRPTASYFEYLPSPAFLEATMENWESEFLQMGMYVLLTVWLRQRGSAESRPFEQSPDEEKIDPGPTPWPVRAGGFWKLLYANSLALAFGVGAGAVVAVTGWSSGRARQPCGPRVSR